MKTTVILSIGMLFSKNCLHQKREKMLIFSILLQGGRRVRSGPSWGFEIKTENSGEFRRDLNTTGYSRTVTGKGTMAG